MHQGTRSWVTMLHGNHLDTMVAMSIAQHRTLPGPWLLWVWAHWTSPGPWWISAWVAWKLPATMVAVSTGSMGHYQHHGCYEYGKHGHFLDTMVAMSMRSMDITSTMVAMSMGSMVPRTMVASAECWHYLDHVFLWALAASRTLYSDDNTFLWAIGSHGHYLQQQNGVSYKFMSSMDITWRPWLLNEHREIASDIKP